VALERNERSPQVWNVVDSISRTKTTGCARSCDEVLRLEPRHRKLMRCSSRLEGLENQQRFEELLVRAQDLASHRTMPSASRLPISSRV
jgi:hypothetical protein